MIKKTKNAFKIALLIPFILIVSILLLMELIAYQIKVDFIEHEISKEIHGDDYFVSDLLKPIGIFIRENKNHILMLCCVFWLIIFRLLL